MLWLSRATVAVTALGAGIWFVVCVTGGAELPGRSGAVADAVARRPRTRKPCRTWHTCGGRRALGTEVSWSAGARLFVSLSAGAPIAHRTWYSLRRIAPTRAKMPWRGHARCFGMC